MNTSPIYKLRKFYSNLSSRSTTPDIDEFTNLFKSKSTTPEIEAYEKMQINMNEEVIIDQNIKKVGNEYIFSNGTLIWIDGISTYVVSTNNYIDNYPVHIYYFIHNGLYKKYGYYNEYNNFVECTLT
jgi:hypothetical protein